MTDRDPILDAVDALAPAFEAAGLDELELTVGDLHVRLARSRSAVMPVVAPVVGAPPAPPAADLRPSEYSPPCVSLASRVPDPFDR